MTTPKERLAGAIRSPKGGRTVARMPYVVSGWPDKDGFSSFLDDVAEMADAIEVGVPFSDPMADGPVIAQAARQALESGVTLPWILEVIGERERAAPMVLMSYLNPLEAYGLERLVVDAKAAGVCGFIVPDLPFEEGDELQALCDDHGMGLVQLVTPVTPSERLRRLGRVSGGFVYAVTVTGITGTSAAEGTLGPYLSRVKGACDAPVCAGFGIKSRADIEALEGVADGAIVGTALIRQLAAGGYGAGRAFLQSLG
jgi:tryptophan synthase alpha chain